MQAHLTPSTWNCTAEGKAAPGADPDIEEGWGGGAYTEWGWCGHAARAASAVCCARIITQLSVVWGSGGMLSQEDFLNLDHVRVLLRPSKTTITTQNLSQVDCNLGDLSYGRFLEPLPFRITEPLYVRYCRCCLLGADLSALCLQDMKQ